MPPRSNIPRPKTRHLSASSAKLGQLTHAASFQHPAPARTTSFSRSPSSPALFSSPGDTITEHVAHFGSPSPEPADSDWLGGSPTQAVRDTLAVVRTSEGDRRDGSSSSSASRGGGGARAPSSTSSTSSRYHPRTSSSASAAEELGVYGLSPSLQYHRLPRSRDRSPPPSSERRSSNAGSHRSSVDLFREGHPRTASAASSRYAPSADPSPTSSASAAVVAAFAPPRHRSSSSVSSLFPAAETGALPPTPPSSQTSPLVDDSGPRVIRSTTTTREPIPTRWTLAHNNRRRAGTLQDGLEAPPSSPASSSFSLATQRSFDSGTARPPRGRVGSSSSARSPAWMGSATSSPPAAPLPPLPREQHESSFSSNAREREEQWYYQQQREQREMQKQQQQQQTSHHLPRPRRPRRTSDLGEDDERAVAFWDEVGSESSRVGLPSPIVGGALGGRLSRGLAVRLERCIGEKDLRVIEQRD